ncbi:L-serine ammonia-lyase, iron-sulfur-dependent, subunit alpha [bacterium]|nr:L-serine ammonia-lyase, iron-sulfur-dependent, subunit alpha [bacterium]
MIKDIRTFSDLLEICTNENKTICEVFELQEANFQEISVEQVRLRVKKALDAMKNAIEIGLTSKEKSISGQCGDDCVRLKERYSKKHAIFGECFEKITTYALATSEENLRMGKIVACPTAGSCGIVPSVIIGISEEYKFDENTQIDALITAGAVATIVSYKMSLAGAVGGCQAECGVASAMAAAAVTQMFGGSVKQILNAVALCLKNILGLTCDPVAGLVEIPCVKRNPFLAINSITAFEFAISDIESKIPTDEVVDAMAQIGELMSPTLKESSQAGLAKTKTAVEIDKKLKDKYKGKI